MGITPQLCAHFIRLMCKRIILPNTLERQGPSVDDLKMRRRQSASAFEERFANFGGKWTSMDPDMGKLLQNEANPTLPAEDWRNMAFNPILPWWFAFQFAIRSSSSRTKGSLTVAQLKHAHRAFDELFINEIKPAPKSLNVLKAFVGKRMAVSLWYRFKVWLGYEEGQPIVISPPVPPDGGYDVLLPPGAQSLVVSRGPTIPAETRTIRPLFPDDSPSQSSSSTKAYFELEDRDDLLGEESPGAAIGPDDTTAITITTCPSPGG
ncbi:hypothetical protein ADUPG1_007372, partial [Aduncisulcus paluster]